MKTYLKLFLTAAFWGGTFIAGRIVTQNVGPYSVAFLRFFLATLFLFFVTLRIEGRIPKLKVRHFTPVLSLGITGVFLYNIFFFSGLSLIPASRASLIIANNPIVISLLSAVFFNEKISGSKILGILLSVFGAIVVISRGDLNSLLDEGVGTGEVLILGCVASWGAYTLIGKSVMKELSPTVSVFYSAVIGTCLLLIPALLEGLPSEILKLGFPEWISVVYLSLCGTVIGFIWYYQGVREIGPGRASLFINFVPVCAVLMAYLILGEPITESLLFGAMFVTLGVFLTNRQPIKGG